MTLCAYFTADKIKKRRFIEDGVLGKSKQRTLGFCFLYEYSIIGVRKI
jgi:hypothetical protein